MNIIELFEKILEVTDIKPNRIKDIRTSIKQYAQVLGYDNLTYCQIEAYNLLPKERNMLIDGKLKNASYFKIRNLKNNISYLLRKAYELNLLTDPQIILNRAKENTVKNTTLNFVNRKKRANSERNLLPPFRLKYQSWNPKLKCEYDAYEIWSTKPLSVDRPAHIKKRIISVQTEKEHLEALCGYLVNIKRFDPNKIDFNEIFKFENISDFENWYINDRHNEITTTSINILKTLTTIAKYYLKNDKLSANIDYLKKTLSKPKRTYNKDEVWVSLQQLEIIGLAEYEKAKKITINPRSKTPGLRKALIMQYSLMLRLLIRCPMRQRNIREMLLDHNLKNIGDKWLIEFRGEENKIARRNGEENIYRMNFPIDIQQQLEEFLTEYHPIISSISANSKNIFLTKSGTLHTRFSLNHAIKRLVYSYVGIPLNVHMIRTIWATEFLMKTKDFITASIRLNDKVETVLNHYSHLYNIDVEVIVQNFLKESLIERTLNNSRT